MILIILDAQTRRRPYQIAVSDSDTLFEVAAALSASRRQYKVWDSVFRPPYDYGFGEMAGWYVPVQTIKKVPAKRKRQIKE